MYCIGIYQYITETRTKELFRLSSTILDQPQYRSSPYSLTQSTQIAQPRSVRIHFFYFSNLQRAYSINLVFTSLFLLNAISPAAIIVFLQSK